ncbi:hypothetical protein M436DRAFT_85682 [Aureobasidium namibiae CBS 147.97]|uniref:F-box domain-containing protein n=1 Tax=Aureobasidium namibiae CBS 147.97 TaxID=1043004 RepID=A0A074WHS2_9PEZI|nr:uncharacterized protein M436DRAFT_85682 [Aureobasidium namibiae CBS 147.97]KEQ69397.1 hypothetical protein M436DRAFT_85682 [Aureobasidium namibiae CBS 147.97]
MDLPTSFSSLPPELVDKICRNSTLEKEDLIALRLTSKSHGIHLSASKEFAKRYFTDISLIYSRYSLQTFAEVCRHSVFGSAVRKVQLSYARFMPEFLGEESKDLFERLRLGARSRGRFEYLDNIRLLVNRCDEEEDLQNSGDAEGLLAAAFTALCHWHHPLELVVSSSETRALGLNRVYSPNIMHSTHWKCHIFGTIALLCRAATLSRCVVQKLKIWGDIWDNLVDSSADSLSVLAQLPELELDTWCPSGPDTPHIPRLENMVINMLNDAVSLKELHLGSLCVNRYHKCLRRIFLVLSTMKLEKLTLSGIDLDGFEPFLEKRIESLRHLEMDQCELWDGSLKNVLISVQENLPRLEYFLVHGISRPWINQKIELKGVQGVHDGINKLIQTRQIYLQDSEHDAWNSDGY